MRCSSDVLKKTSPLDVFGNVSEKVKHLTNDASNDVSPPALRQTLYIYGKLIVLIFVSSKFVKCFLPFLQIIVRWVRANF